jgi:hypothetical protein
MTQEEVNKKHTNGSVGIWLVCDNLTPVPSQTDLLFGSSYLMGLRGVHPEGDKGVSLR